MIKSRRSMILPLAVSLLAACGGGSAAEDSMDEESMTDETVMFDDGLDESTATVTVEDAWARTSPMGTDTGVVYVILTSDVDDAVISADVDINVAMSAEVHETTSAADGTLGMQMVDSVALPAGQQVAFEPGGYHIMLMGLIEPLVAGNIVSVTLTLESGNLVTVDAEVRDDAE